MTHSPKEAPASPLAETPLEVLEHSPLLAALVGHDNQLHHCNHALRQRLGRTQPGECGSFDGLFQPWARQRIREEALPAARREGLWEGEASLNRGDAPIPLHVTLVADIRPDPPEPGLLLALMVPRTGLLEAPAHPVPSATGSTVTPLEPETVALHRLAVPLYQETRFLDPETISCLGADGHYTRIHTRGSVLLASLPLGSFEAELPETFLRVHRSYVVNLAHVEALVRQDGGHALRLTDPGSTLVPVSRRRLARVRERLGAVHME